MIICIHTVSGFSISVTKLKPNQVSVNPGDEVFIKFNVNDLKFSSYDEYLEYSTDLVNPKWVNGCTLDCGTNNPVYNWDETRLHIERPFGFNGIDNFKNGVSGEIPSSSALSNTILVNLQKRGPGIPVSSANAAILKYSDVFSTTTTIPTPMNPTPITSTPITSQPSSPTKVTPSGLEIDKNTTSWIFGILIAAILFGIIEYARSKKSGGGKEKIQWK